MIDTTDRMPRIRGLDRPRAFAVISEAVWWVTIVDGTLVRYHPEAYDRVLAEWSPREREALRTLAAASPDVRAEAVGDTPATRDQANPPPADAASGDGVSSERPRGAVADPPTTRPTDPRAPAAERPVAVDGGPSPRAPAPPRDPGPGGATPDGDKG